MSWKRELEELIKSRWQPGQSFRLGQVYEFEATLSRLHPSNRHARDKIRQTLQYLRDDGLLSFVGDRGVYIRLR